MVDGKPARRSLSDSLAQLEREVQLFSEHVAEFGLRTKQARATERV
jgi:hypothetical protein